MRVGSLFAGIGGFDLAARWMGWTTSWFSEVEPYAAAVLKKHWPDVPNLGDITHINGSHVPPTDILVGGFPCQDISLAGKGAGLAGARSGLWYHYARLIEEIRPQYVVAENVSALRARGLDEVLRTLAEIGYDAEWHCIPASAVGAPHQRDRIWIVAYAALGGRGEERADVRGRAGGSGPEGRDGCGPVFDGVSAGESMADAASLPESKPGHEAEAVCDQRDARLVAGGSRSRFTNGEPGAELADALFPRLEGHAGNGNDRDEPGRLAAQAGGSVSPARVRDGADAEGWWASEPNVGRVAHGVPARVDRLRCLGNALVPQIAYRVFQAIGDRERRLNEASRR